MFKALHWLQEGREAVKPTFCRFIAIVGAVVLGVGVSACGKPEPASNTKAVGAAGMAAKSRLVEPAKPPAAQSPPEGPKPPEECGLANSAAECAEILKRMGKDPAAAFGTAGSEPVYTGIPAAEMPPCKSGAAKCEPWERMWHQ